MKARRKKKKKKQKRETRDDQKQTWKARKHKTSWETMEPLDEPQLARTELK